MSLSGADGRPFPGHVLVTGGAGFIGSHATMADGRGIRRHHRGHTRAAIRARSPRSAWPRGKLRVVEGDLGVREDVERAFVKYPVDVVIHFAAIAYVGESMADPNRYYHNITSNTVIVLETMQKFGAKRLVYSSTCATYGNPDVLPITEKTPTVPIPGKASTPRRPSARLRRIRPVVPGGDSPLLQRLRERPRGTPRRVPQTGAAPPRTHQRRVFDAALGLIPELVVMGTDFPTGVHSGGTSSTPRIRRPAISGRGSGTWRTLPCCTTSARVRA